MLKKILFAFASTLLLYNSCLAQSWHDQFLLGFYPENNYYEGHHGYTDSHFLLDTLLWDAWEDGHSAGGAYWKVLHHYRHDFSYLPNGDIYQVFQYVKDDHGSWKQTDRHTFEYNEQNQMTSCICDHLWYGGNWGLDVRYDYAYDEWNRIIRQHSTTWDGSQNEMHYKYDDAGRIACEAYFLYGIDIYFDRLLYNYEDDELTSKCYQRYYTSTGWLNSDLYLYTYDSDRISNVLHQGWSLTNSKWYNIENETYEYDDSRNIVIITTQKWDDGWVNYSRTTKTMNENDVLVHELYQVWQNGLWIDKKNCDYMLDESGNCIEGKWEDYTNGEWVDCVSNNSLLIQYNNRKSVLSEAAVCYKAHYSYFIGNNETSNSVVFPNPGTTQLTIRTDTPSTNNNVIVYDLLGRQMFHQTMSEATIRINTESWPSGVYFWKTYNPSSAQCGKWVKN